MKISNSSFYFSLILATCILGAVSPVLAETYTVKMMSTDPDDPSVAMDFVPAFLKIEKGDTVIFEATQKGHNSATKKGMLPEGAKKWNGRINKSIEVTYDTDGTYGYFCVPHYSVGMVGLILVGDYSVNFEEARKVKQRGKAKRAFKALFERADALKQKSSGNDD